MTTRAALIALLFPLVLACRPALGASIGTATCRPADTYAVNLVAYVTEIATGSDRDSREARRAYGIRMTPDSIALISDEVLCQRGASALRNAMGANLRSESIRVYVVRAGNDYVVTDPDHQIGFRTARITVALDN